MLVMGEFLDDTTPDGQLLLTAVPEKKAIPDIAIDAALQRNGSGFEGGKYRIYAYFSENHTAQERANFLKNEFGIGGICPALPGSRLDEWHDSKGIRFTRGDSSGTQVEIRLSWSQMQSRIMGLVTADHYLTPREKADMPAYQQHAEQKRREAAERDADWKSAHTASPTVQPFQKTDVALRADALARATPPPTIQMSLFPTAKQQQIEIAQAEDAQSSAFSLAQDDINQVLSAGSLFQNGKFRIAEQFARHQSAKINADFLKNEYGQSGGSLTFSDETSGQVQYTAKGISIYKSRRGSEPDKFLPWADAEKLIRALIETDRYLTPEERTAYTAWKKERTEALASTEQLHVHNRSPHQETTAEENTQLSFSQVTDSHSDVPDTHSKNPDAPEKIGSNLTVTRQADALFIDRAGTEPGTGTYVDMDVTMPDEVADAIQKQIPIGETLTLYERQFTVNSVNYDSGKVNLRDETFAKHTGFPIFRVESLDFVRDALQKEARDQKKATNKNVQPPQPKGIQKEPEALLQNFRITEDTLPAGGPKARYARNVAAIRTLRQIEAEKRPATAKEQAVLSAYAGWGGVAQAFDAGDPKWQSEYAELKDLLTDEDYAAARSSVLNAHYTSPTIIRAMYSGLERLGFQTGNVLEPACGTGNFFGMVPESMGASKLYGVELDGITGRIAKQLYPQADITVDGFENTDFPDEFFDVAIGNVPFGNYKLPDRRYAKSNFLIHDYFFAKSLDKVRPGGLIAFITSKGTMDKRDNTVRRYIARRADLLGAVRLPNNAFAGAGTEVTADIIFLQKRDRLMDEEPDWLFPSETGDSVTVNRYFADHPEMVLGEMEYVSGPYGQETACLPIPGVNLAEQLEKAMRRLELPDRAIFDISVPEPDGDLEEDIPSSLPADPDVRNFSYTLVDDHLYFRENSRMNVVHLPETTERRVCGMMELRDCTRKLIALQMEDAADDVIQQTQAQLNILYDAYSKDYGLLSSQGNRRAFENDASYSLLTSLEVVDENGRLERKADMFSKRTIRHAQPVTSVDTASDALAVSIAEQAGVDMAYMQELTGFSEEKLTKDLTGIIFRNLGDADPATVPKAFVKLEAFPYVTADEYLSGNVRAKLRMAKALAEMRPDFAEQIMPNIVALEKVQPKDLSAGEIDVRLGVTWIEPMYIDQFMADVLKTPRVLLLNSIHTQYADVSGVWNIRGKSADSMDNVRVHTTYGTKRRNAYYILEDSLNLKDVRIFDTVLDAEGREHRVLNGKETAIAQQKQDALRQAFQDWIWKDPDRRQTLVKKYNELFNSTRPREYDGQHIVFNGMNPEIQLRPYQRNAVAHVLYGHNALLAHCVGAGKTYEMIASAMESKRLGLCNKALFVVPNHLTEQWGSDFLRLYPGANVLVATRKDFEPANRKRFCARIATGDYDAIIIGHSQFEKIPVSPERQARTIQRQIDDIELALEQVSNEDGQRYTVKQLENTRKSLEVRLKKLNDTERKDNVVTFEELGVDRLFVDEADTYKNLFLFTKMRNVAGIGQTEAQKSSDMYAKCQYMDELTGERGIVFATGTPISNSMVELFTMMRYLQSSMLHEHGLDQFDSWAAAFGERVTAMELKPEGTGFRAKTRFARFFNLPELMSLWKEAADIQTADMLHLPVPKAEYIDVVTKASTIQKDFVQQFGERAEKVQQNLVEPYEDNMLAITNDGRKLALDQRLMNPLLPDDPDSKISACVKNALQVWQETAEQRGAQLIFCDLSTPHNDGKFNIYDDIREKLTAQGIPAGEIAFIHEAKTETQKKELFARVRKGQVRVLLGSTAKMGAGTNCQDRLAALHHVDCPWRPRDLEQREGRILRFGNKFGTVRIFRYVTQGTFDAYNWSLIENKQKFIGQVVTGKSPARSCEDVDGTALSYAEVKSLATGDPRIKQKMDLDIQVSKLRMLQASYASQKYELEDNLLKHYPQQTQATQEKIAGLTEDEKQVAAHPQQGADHFTMQVMGKTFSDKKAAGEAIIAVCQSIKSKDEVVQLGEYRGFAMQVAFDRLAVTFKLMLKHRLGRSVDVGADALGNITRIDHALSNIPKRLNEAREHLSELQQQMEIAREEVAKPFPQEQELAEKSERLQALNALLSVDDKKPEEPKSQENPAAKKRRASEYER
ncbi:MAG: DEAD/DEAH box helicase family protein [Ethanoligenens sp.]